METVDDLITRTKPRIKSASRNGKRKNSLPPALRRRLLKLLNDALAPVVPYSGDIEAMRKVAEDATRANINEAIKVLGE